VAGRIARRVRKARAAVVDWMNRVWAGDLTAMHGWQLLRRDAVVIVASLAGMACRRDGGRGGAFQAGWRAGWRFPGR